MQNLNDRPDQSALERRVFDRLDVRRAAQAHQLTVIAELSAKRLAQEARDAFRAATARTYGRPNDHEARRGLRDASEALRTADANHTTALEARDRLHRAFIALAETAVVDDILAQADSYIAERGNRFGEHEDGPWLDDAS